MLRTTIAFVEVNSLKYAYWEMRCYANLNFWLLIFHRPSIRRHQSKVTKCEPASAVFIPGYSSLIVKIQNEKYFRKKYTFFTWRFSRWRSFHRRTKKHCSRTVRRPRVAPRECCKRTIDPQTLGPIGHKTKRCGWKWIGEWGRCAPRSDWWSPA